MKYDFMFTQEEKDKVIENFNGNKKKIVEFLESADDFRNLFKETIKDVAKKRDVEIPEEFIDNGINQIILTLKEYVGGDKDGNN